MYAAVPIMRATREERPMPNDVRDLPASNDGLYRFLGGSPLAVAFRLIMLSILVGVVLAAIGFDPWNILHSIQTLFRRLWDLGFDAVNWLWRYFLLGAVIVIPIWLLSRLFGSPRGRSIQRVKAAADAIANCRLRRVVAARAEAARRRARSHRPDPDHAFPRRPFWRAAVPAAGRAVHATLP